MVNLNIRDGEEEGPVLISLKETATLMGCSRLEVYKLARSKRIPAFQFTEEGGRWRVHKPKLLEQLSKAVSERQGL